MAIPKKKLPRDPDEEIDVRDLIAQVVSEPERWLDTPHDLLGGRKPRDLLGTDNEDRLRELARAIKHGIPA